MKRFQLGDLLNWLRKLTGRVKKPDGGINFALLEVAHAFAESVERSFELSRSPSGVGFAPLKSGEQRKPLIKTGLLYDMAIAAAEMTAFDGKSYWTRLTGPFYAKFHQYGTSRIVPRPFFGVDQEAAEQVAEELSGCVVRFIVE